MNVTNEEYDILALQALADAVPGAHLVEDHVDATRVITDSGRNVVKLIGKGYDLWDPRLMLVKPNATEAQAKAFLNGALAEAGQ